MRACARADGVFFTPYKTRANPPDSGAAKRRVI